MRQSVQYKVSGQFSNGLAGGNPLISISVGGYLEYSAYTSGMSFDANGSFTVSFTLPSNSPAIGSNSLMVEYRTGTGGGGLIVQSASRNITAVTATTETSPGVERSGDVVATHLVERFHARVSGFADSEGIFGGGVIDRPDYVMRHFMTRVIGIEASSFDDGSFTASGTAMAGAFEGGCRFAFCLNDKVRPSRILKRMADECASELVFDKGAYRLLHLPISAPEPVKTISSSELAGLGSVLSFGTNERFKNSVTAKYRKNYGPMGSESQWDADVSAQDIEAQAKYGFRHLDMELELVRDSDTAGYVLGRRLDRLNRPLMAVAFPVFYEHFDLRVGDAVEIDNDLYGGTKFRITGIKRLDKFRAEVRAEEWG